MKELYIQKGETYIMRFLQRNTIKLLSIPVLSIILLFVSMTLLPSLHTDAAANIKQTYKPSYGVEYKKLDYTGKGFKGRVNMMEMDISDMFTEVQLGVADPMDNLMSVRNRANTYDRKGNQIIGAINSNFFSVASGKPTRPVHLISKDNRLVYGGYVNKNKNKLFNEPIAFGMDKDGKGLIDHYNLKLTYTFNGKKHKISHTNRERAKNNTILYTSDFYKSNTDTNQYGTEVVLKGPDNPELTLGSTTTYNIVAIRKEGDKKPMDITDDSFVLSGHNKASKRLQKMKVGDTVDINTGMDKKWQHSDFMLAGGPQLVKSGKVNISMNTGSWAATAVTSRTAVGVDKAREKVFFVTVDTSISNGMDINQLAKMMKKLGADSALNLDGGGSTTMVTLPNGGGNLQVVNKLQDGFERSISGVLMAADTEPKRIFSDVSYRDDHYEGIQWAKDNGSITGYPDHTFKPYQKLSREHSAVIFAEAFELDKPKATKVEKLFKDIPASHMYARQIAAVGQADIFSGSNGDFMPEETMTREQMATTIVKAFGWEGSATGEAKINLRNVSPSHRDNVQILADKGITTQLKDFRPGEAVTRGQFASFLKKAHK